jgi:hypothetical protein
MLFLGRSKRHRLDDVVEKCQMAIIRKMTPEEVSELEQKSQSNRQAIAAQYDSLLLDCSIGDEVEIELEPHERRTTAIARLKAAAARRTTPLRLHFRRSRDPLVVRFSVYAVRTPAAQPAVRAIEIEDDDTQAVALRQREQRDAQRGPGGQSGRARGYGRPYPRGTRPGGRDGAERAGTPDRQRRRGPERGPRSAADGRPQQRGPRQRPADGSSNGSPRPHRRPAGSRPGAGRTRRRW